MRVAVVALLTVLACTPHPSELGATSAPQSPSGVGAPAASSQVACDETRQRQLLRSFFDGYAARDLVRVMAAFGVEAGNLGQPGFAKAGLDYYDNVDGEAVQLREAASLRTYLERRWALNDRFEVDVDAIGLYAPFPNPTFSFRRTSDQGTYTGNAKFVCSSGVFTGLVTSSVATTRNECPETTAVGLPSNANTAAFSRQWYASADRRIWASKPDRFYATANKVLWERPTGEQLMVSGRPRGSTGPELVASIPRGYETLDYQASGIDFPVAGCWEVVARSGASELRFVTEVYPQSYYPATGRCADVADAAATARWVLTVRVTSNKPDRPGFIQHETIVLRAWKGDSVPVGHSVAIWQDALYEPILERGRTYVVFLGQHSFGSPAVQYGLTRVLCPLRTIIQIDGNEVRRPLAYTAEQWIWKGTASLAHLEGELSKLGR